MNRIDNWSSVINVVEKRLASWKSKLLSIGGRVTLMRSVLENLPIYYFSLFKAPSAVIEKVEGIMRRFLWVGSSEEKKINWVAWERVVRPRKIGGLGLSRLKHTNETLLLKWSWQFKKDGNCLWKRFIVVCHGGTRSWSFLPLRSAANGCWREIVKIREGSIGNGKKLNSFLRGVAVDGVNIRIWCDPWLLEFLLRYMYPNIFRLESQKWCSVADRVNFQNNDRVMRWAWRQDPRSSVELNELFGLLSNIYEYDWAAGCDK
ncbi:putative mitochondrial protein AtMg00310 [Bidens hawaiensis]|uniref:putative mitochondrial protein AtMg00310 n=1 Tax=Bidens hawaiensis TaxID=980011 RepID=UPI00404B3BD9